jgi:hypothetical protein
MRSNLELLRIPVCRARARNEVFKIFKRDQALAFYAQHILTLRQNIQVQIPHHIVCWNDNLLNILEYQIIEVEVNIQSRVGGVAIGTNREEKAVESKVDPNNVPAYLVRRGT